MEGEREGGRGEKERKGGREREKWNAISILEAR